MLLEWLYRLCCAYMTCSRYRNWFPGKEGRREGRRQDFPDVNRSCSHVLLWTVALQVKSEPVREWSDSGGNRPSEHLLGVLARLLFVLYIYIAAYCCPNDSLKGCTR